MLEAVVMSEEWFTGAMISVLVCETRHNTEVILIGRNIGQLHLKRISGMTNQRDSVRWSNSCYCDRLQLQCDTTFNQSYRLTLCRSCVLLFAPLWSRLHRTFAKLGRRPVVFASANQLPYLKVFLAVSVEIFPLLDLLLHFLPCLPSFPLCSCLPLSTADDLFIIVYGNIYE